MSEKMPWKKPPSTTEVEWPTGPKGQTGMTLDEQLQKIKDFRLAIVGMITSKGYPVPEWARVDKPTTPYPIYRGPPIVSSTPAPRNGRSQSPWAASSGHSGQRGGPTQTAARRHLPPSPLVPRPGEDDDSHVPEQPKKAKRKQKKKSSASRGQQPEDKLPEGELPEGIDPSILNPRVYIVNIPEGPQLPKIPKLPAYILDQFKLRHAGSPPRAPKAMRLMLEESQDQHMALDANGNWTTSKIWISDSEKLRLSFARMQQQTHHIGADKSPFLPQTVSEYAAFLAECKDAEVRVLRKAIERKEERKKQREEEDRAGKRDREGARKETFFEMLEREMAKKQARPEAAALLAGKKFDDGLSKVLARKSSFNELVEPVPEEEKIEWPPLSEFKRQRAHACGPRNQRRDTRGVWPAPRMNSAAPGVPCAKHEGEIPYRHRKLVMEKRWDWDQASVAKIAYDLSCHEEVAVEEILPFIGALLEEIEKSNDE